MTSFVPGYMLAANANVSTTGAVVAGNVSVTANSLPTNGLFLSAANTLAFATNSTQKVTIDSTGNVGIATTSPTAPLHVFGTNTGTGQSSPGTIIGRFMDGQGRNSVTINGGIDGTAPATNATLNLGGGASLTWSLSTTHGANMATALAGTTSTGLAVGGYVGIGTGTANYPLQVRRAGGAGSLGINIDNYLAIGDASTLHYAIGDTTTQPTAHIFFTRNSTATDVANMFIRPGGQVTKPQQPFFSAYRSTAVDYTGGATVIWDTTLYNVGNSYSTSTGRFTAPVAGVYLFRTDFRQNGNGAGYLDIVRSDGLITRHEEGNALNGFHQTLACIYYLNAGDYAYTRQGGATAIRPDPGTTDRFEGYLLG